MFKRISCALVSLGVVMALGGPALAAETGTIRVTLQNGESLVPDGSVVLYYVASPAEDDYRLTEAFGGGIIREEDSLSPALASWLAEEAEDDGWEKRLDGFGSAEFGDLQEGLYLLMQEKPSTGYHLMAPMLVQIPCEFQWHVQSYPSMEEIVWEQPQTGDTFPLLLGTFGVILSGSGLMVCTYQNRRRRRAKS